MNEDKVSFKIIKVSYSDDYQIHNGKFGDDYEFLINEDTKWNLISKERLKILQEHIKKYNKINWYKLLRLIIKRTELPL